MVRYLGSRTQIAGRLVSLMYNFCGIKKSSEWTVYDICAGTGVISLELKNRKFNVFSNDVNEYAYLVNCGLFEMGADTGCQQLYNDIYGKPQWFTNTFAERMTGLEEFFNNVRGVQGMITELYTEMCTQKTRYYSIENAMKIDAIRQYLNMFKDNRLINTYEFNYLLMILLECADEIANTKFKYDVALGKEPGPEPMIFIDTMKRVRYKFAPTTKKCVSQFDVEYTSIGQYGNTITVLDPPFQKRRNYSTLYGVPTTIALYDNPKVKGLYNARTDDLKSNFCYVKTYQTALKNTLQRIPTKYIVFLVPSYNYNNLCDFEKTEKLLEQLNFKRIRKEVVYPEKKPNFCFQWRNYFDKTTSVIAYFIEQ